MTHSGPAQNVNSAEVGKPCCGKYRVKLLVEILLFLLEEEGKRNLQTKL